MALRGRGSYNVDFKLEGNWFKFNEIVNGTNILMVLATRQGQKEFAESYKAKVQKNILTGGKRFGYPQNSPGYTYWKLQRGGPSSALVWSRSFYANIEIRENKLKSRYMVGIPKGTKRPSYSTGDKNRLTIAEYANVLEHGTNKIPPRPIFKDTFKHDMKGKAGLKRYMELAILRKFGARGIIVNK